MANAKHVDRLQVAMIRLYIATRSAGALLHAIAPQIDSEPDPVWDITIGPADINQIMRIVGTVGTAGDAIHALLLERDVDPEALGALIYSPDAVMDRIQELRDVATGTRLLGHSELLKMARHTALQMCWLGSLSGITPSPITKANARDDARR